MKIFLTMISVLAFTWSCGAASSPSGDDGGVLSLFAPGDLVVLQEGATPIATGGETIENNGINEVSIELSGITNRDSEEVTVELTLSEGVTKHLTDDTNTEAEGVLTLTIPDPADEGDVDSDVLGQFVVESNSIQYNLIVSGAFTAQAIVPAPTTDEIVVTLAGSTSIVTYDDLLTYTVSGLTNSDVSDVAGSISISGYRQNGFMAVLGIEDSSSVVLADPTGISSVVLDAFTTITVTEVAYPANAETYTINVIYDAFGGAPPPASAIIVNFLGSLSVANPGDTNLDVSFSETTSTYTVAGLTNRPNEGVSLDTNDEFIVGDGYAVSSITNTYASTPDTDASSGAVELGTFTITDASSTGDTGTTYTISGIFAAQISLPSDLTLAEMTAAVTLSGSTISNVSRAGNTYTYTVEGLTNRTNEDVTINTEAVTLPPEFGFNPALPTYTLDGAAAAINTTNFLTFRIEETAYTNNGNEYTIGGEFAAQATLPTMETATVSYSTNVDSNISPTTSDEVGVSFLRDTRRTTSVSIDASFTDAAAVFEYFDRAPTIGQDDGSIDPIVDPGNVMAIGITPRTAGIYEIWYTIREKAYHLNGVDKKYIVQMTD